MFMNIRSLSNTLQFHLTIHSLHVPYVLHFKLNFFHRGLELKLIIHFRKVNIEQETLYCVSFCLRLTNNTLKTLRENTCHN